MISAEVLHKFVQIAIHEATGREGDDNPELSELEALFLETPKTFDCAAFEAKLLSQLNREISE